MGCKIALLLSGALQIVHALNDHVVKDVVYQRQVTYTLGQSLGQPAQAAPPSTISVTNTVTQVAAAASTISIINTVTQIVTAAAASPIAAGTATVILTVTITEAAKGGASPALQTAGIVASSRQAAAGDMGVPQPPSMVAPAINSATLLLDGLIGGGSAQASSNSTAVGPTAVGPVATTPITSSAIQITASTSAQSVAGGINSATLMTAGILVSSQPGSEATVGVPQPPAPSGNPTPINSATLATANIVGGKAANSTTARGSTGAGNSLTFGRVLQGGCISGTLIAFLL